MSVMSVSRNGSEREYSPENSVYKRMFVAQQQGAQPQQHRGDFHHLSASTSSGPQQFHHLAGQQMFVAQQQAQQQPQRIQLVQESRPTPLGGSASVPPASSACYPLRTPLSARTEMSHSVYPSLHSCRIMASPLAGLAAPLTALGTPSGGGGASLLQRPPGVNVGGVRAQLYATGFQDRLQQRPAAAAPSAAEQVGTSATTTANSGCVPAPSPRRATLGGATTVVPSLGVTVPVVPGLTGGVIGPSPLRSLSGSRSVLFPGMMAAGSMSARGAASSMTTLPTSKPIAAAVHASPTTPGVAVYTPQPRAGEEVAAATVAHSQWVGVHARAGDANSGSSAAPDAVESAPHPSNKTTSVFSSSQHAFHQQTRPSPQSGTLQRSQATLQLRHERNAIGAAVITTAEDTTSAGMDVTLLGGNAAGEPIFEPASVSVTTTPSQRPRLQMQILPVEDALADSPTGESVPGFSKEAPDPVPEASTVAPVATVAAPSSTPSNTAGTPATGYVTAKSPAAGSTPGTSREASTGKRRNAGFPGRSGPAGDASRARVFEPRSAQAELQKALDESSQHAVDHSRMSTPRETRKPALPNFRRAAGPAPAAGTIGKVSASNSRSSSREPVGREHSLQLPSGSSVHGPLDGAIGGGGPAPAASASGPFAGVSSRATRTRKNGSVFRPTPAHSVEEDLSGWSVRSTGGASGVSSQASRSELRAERWHGLRKEQQVGLTNIAPVAEEMEDDGAGAAGSWHSMPGEDTAVAGEHVHDGELKVEQEQVCLSSSQLIGVEVMPEGRITNGTTPKKKMSEQPPEFAPKPKANQREVVEVGSNQFAHLFQRREEYRREEFRTAVEDAARREVEMQRPPAATEKTKILGPTSRTVVTGELPTLAKLQVEEVPVPPEALSQRNEDQHTHDGHLSETVEVSSIANPATLETPSVAASTPALDLTQYSPLKGAPAAAEKTSAARGRVPPAPIQKPADNDLVLSEGLNIDRLLRSVRPGLRAETPRMRRPSGDSFDELAAGYRPPARVDRTSAGVPPGSAASSRAQTPRVSSSSSSANFNAGGGGRYNPPQPKKRLPPKISKEILSEIKSYAHPNGTAQKICALFAAAAFGKVEFLTPGTSWLQIRRCFSNVGDVHARVSEITERLETPEVGKKVRGYLRKHNLTGVQRLSELAPALIRVLDWVRFFVDRGDDLAFVVPRGALGTGDVEAALEKGVAEIGDPRVLGDQTFDRILAGVILQRKRLELAKSRRESPVSNTTTPLTTTADLNRPELEIFANDIPSSAYHVPAAVASRNAQPEIGSVFAPRRPETPGDRIRDSAMLPSTRTRTSAATTSKPPPDVQLLKPSHEVAPNASSKETEAPPSSKEPASKESESSNVAARTAGGGGAGVLAQQDENVDELEVLPDIFAADYAGDRSAVRDLVIAKAGVGSVLFEGMTNLSQIPDRPALAAKLQLLPGEIVVYPGGGEGSKPPVGEELNKPAYVTLLNCRPPGAGEVTPQVGRRYEEKVRRMTELKGAQFVSYDAKKGIWVFRVEHF